ncbi:MAG: TonB-dependent receptor [Alphaproteobacteria bacterium]|nr:TonB-dependent receptor [Alphaproteobacteria bacterium]
MFTNQYRNRLSILLTTSAIASVPALAANNAPPLEEQLEEIVVSGAYEGRKLGETILGATVLRKDEIMRQLDGSLGETLKRQPGMSSTFFGPGASRPIIRGLGGDRIRVLDANLGSIDASSTSPDHAVAVEPALAERIEILRGTAMLMYGSSAAGGVVNTFDGRIPTTLPEGGVEGAVRYGHSTVNDGDEVTAAVNALIGKLGNANLVAHADFMYRDTDDYKIPGFAESEAFHEAEEAEEDHDEDHEGEREEEAFGFVENTATETTGGSGGLSLVFDDGFFGMNVKKLDSRYGVPGHAHAHGEEHEGLEDHEDEDHEDEGHEEEAPVSIDLDQTRYDLHGELSRDFGLFKKAKLRFGYADYKHTELEGAEVGTVFKNKGWEGRLDLIEKAGNGWSGATGVQVRHRDFSAIGAEAFVPPVITDQFGLYSVKEIDMGRFSLEFGGRFEHTTHDVEILSISRTFNGFSTSAGLGYDLNDAAFIGLNISRTERAPSSEELFSNGPHLATSAFELGDPDLGLETALGLEATFSYATGPISFVVNGFITSYDDFIYEAETGLEEDGLEVFQFTAQDATFRGFEAKVEYHAGTLKTHSMGDIDLHLDGQVDLVHASLDGLGEDGYLPRIPPMSALLGLNASALSMDFRTELEYAAKQSRVSEHELPSEDYLLWNAYLTIRPFDDKNLSLSLKATNIGNVEARQHTSFLKEVAPLPGRNLSVSFRAAF